MIKSIILIGGKYSFNYIAQSNCCIIEIFNRSFLKKNIEIKHVYKFPKIIRDDIQMTSKVIAQFLRPSTPLPIYVQICSSPLTLDIQLQMKPPLQVITNQLKENIVQGWLSYVIRFFLQVGFCFQYQLISLAWLSFDFLSFSWSLIISFFLALYSCVRSYPKISQNVFYLYMFTFSVLIL